MLAHSPGVSCPSLSCEEAAAWHVKPHPGSFIEVFQQPTWPAYRACCLLQWMGSDVGLMQFR